MKILFIHQHFYPEESGTAKSCTEMAVYFAEQGHDVSVITEFPNRGFKSTSELHQKPLKQVDTHKEITIHRLRNKFKYSSKVVSRISAYLMFTLGSVIYALRMNQKFDLCITIQALPSAIPGVVLQKFYRIPHHFYCTDMMPDLGIVSGMVKNRLVISAARIVEKAVYDHSTAVYAVTRQMVDNIKSKSSNPNIFELPDWLDGSFFNANRYKFIDCLKKKYELQDKRVMLYIGNIGFVQNLGIVVESAKLLSREDAYKDCLFIIGGGGVQKEALERECEKRGLKNIRFIGVVPRQHVPSFLELSSVLVMNYMDHPHMALYRSSKIFDYIVAEKPVIVGATGALKEIVEQNGLGYVASPSDPEEFTAKLMALLDERRVLNNKELIEAYSRENVLGSFARKVSEMKIRG